MKDLYETEISNIRWIAYDLPGNVGWILYLVVLVRLFVNDPAYLSDSVTRTLTVLAVVPAVLMLIGIAELISERIHKLDRVLSRVRLLRGFGALTLGGGSGTVVAAALFVFAKLRDYPVRPAVLLGVGGLLCAIFAGLLFQGYHRKEPF